MNNPYPNPTQQQEFNPYNYVYGDNGIYFVHFARNSDFINGGDNLFTGYCRK